MSLDLMNGGVEMRIYKFIENCRYEGKPSYMKLPNDVILHKEYSDPEYGESWCIVVRKEWYDKNHSELFPKGYDHHRTRRIEIGEFLFIFIYGILSDNWIGMGDDFYTMFDEYLSKFFVVENRKYYKEWDEIHEMSEWNGSFNAVYTEYADEDRTKVKVRMVEEVLVPISVMKFTGIRDGIFEMLRIEWSDPNSKKKEWSISKKRIHADELELPNDWNNKITYSTDPTLWNEKKQQYLKYIR